MPPLVDPADRQLTAVQRAILDFVLDYNRRCRHPPSYRDIGDAVNLRSRQPGRPRSIVVTALYRPGR